MKNLILYSLLFLTKNIHLGFIYFTIIFIHNNYAMVHLNAI